MAVNSRLQATKNIGQRKAFYRQNLAVRGTSRNGDGKIMQSIKITSRPTY